MEIIGRLKGDPEERPVNPALVIPDTEIPADEDVPPDEGDADYQEKQREKKS
jgi:hypothetical protein